ncbi:MAG: hypothetical protein CVU09_00805 [Bacteroidetes bacterium HGW-Bacteroidetes-4]|jgi:hypothetical protein|nr:MAG: hypothetical protein CVU09_00805 [Bacteroidetes bacterium HGW-Bacteroidetes-4]
MPKESVKYQRQIIGVEKKLGFLYVPAQARQLLPSETGKVMVHLEGDSKPKERSYNADYNRIFGLTSWYKKYNLDKGHTLDVEVSADLIKVSIATEAIIEEPDEIEDSSVIDISGLSSQAKGNIGEDRVKEVILLNSQGLLNVYKPVIDDRGIDLIVLKEGVFHSIYLQVKSRFNVGKNNQLILTISKNTFKPHHAYYLVGISYDPAKAEIGEHILFIPSKKVIELATTVQNNGKESYRINVSYSNTGNSKYSKYFMSKTEFVDALLEKFEIMGEMIK